MEENDLLESVKNNEHQWLQKEKTLLANLSAFDYVLKDAYETRRPTSNDYDKRRDLILVFNEIARELFGDKGTSPVVKEFGSYLMDMFDASSDLDLSINLSDTVVATRRVTQNTLRKLVRKLYRLRDRGHVTDIKPILGARVPVVKVTDCGSGVECDLSVGNLDGIAKSQIVLLVSSIDERFQKLCFLMKAWAKAQDINSAVDGSLNSLSLILLAAFHLQTRDRPILPPFSAILRDGTDLDTVKKSINSFMNYGKNNKESLAELFVSLLVKLESVDGLWSEGLCASAFEGSWICKKWARKKGPMLGCISVEDFTDRSQNASRALKSFETHMKIYTCIHFSLNQIRLFTEGKVNAVKLKHLLFGEHPSSANKVTTLFNLASMRTQKQRNYRSSLKKLAGSVPTQTVQGSQSENMNLVAPALLAGQLVSVSSSSIEGYRPGTHHVSPGLISDQPVSVHNEKKRKQPLPGDLKKDSNVISTTPRIAKSQKKLNGNQTVQGSVQGSQSENLNLAAPALLAGQLASVSTLSPGVIPHQPKSARKKKKKKQPPPGDSRKSSNVITSIQGKAKPQKKLSGSLPTHIVQGSRSENLNLAAPARSGQLVSVSSSSIQGYGGRPESHHVPPGLMSVRPLSVPNLPYQDSRSSVPTLPYQDPRSSVPKIPYQDSRSAVPNLPYQDSRSSVPNLPYQDSRSSVPNLPYQDSRRFEHARTLSANPSHVASTFMEARPAPAPYHSNQGAGRYGLDRIHVQDSRSFGQERTHTESPSHVSTTFMVGRPTPTPAPNQGAGRYGLERIHVQDSRSFGHGRSHTESLSHVSTTFMADRAAAPYLSNHGAGRYGLERIHVEVSRSFGQERGHTENLSHASSTFTADRPAVAPYVPNQGSGRYGLERNHVPDLSFQGQQRSHAEGFSRGGENFPVSHSTSFYRPEGTHDHHRHANSRDSRSHSTITMPPNHDHARSERSHVPPPSFPLGPSYYPKDSREHENRHGRW